MRERGHRHRRLETGDLHVGWSGQAYQRGLLRAPASQVESPAMEGHTHECQYLWSGFGFPFFLMLFAVVSLKCNRPSVTLVTWSAGRSILKQTAEIPRHCERIWTLDHLYLVLRSSGMSSTPHPHHSEENSLLQAPIFNKLSTTRSEMAARE